MEHCFRAREAMNNMSCKSFTSKVDEPETNQNEGFECNICLDLVQDPVVTFCGHLYCWSCIYKWIMNSPENPETPDERKPLCPVCKIEVSEKTLIPLYGRGGTLNPSKPDSQPIPKRPSSPLSISGNGSPQFDHFHDRSYMRPPHLTTAPAPPPPPVFDPMFGSVFGEMVYARIFRNGETTLYTYPNSYHYSNQMTPRQQQQINQVNRSLSRLCFFLCCCTVFCLLMF